MTSTDTQVGDQWGDGRAYILDRIEYDTNGGCWLWGGTLNVLHGYGRAWVGGRQLASHRVSYEAFVGPPGKHWVLHKCDVRSCVNPEHLYLGTAKDNAADMRQRGRAVYLSSGMIRAKLSDADRMEIKTSSSPHSTIAAQFGVCTMTVRRVRNGRASRSLKAGRCVPYNPDAGAVS